MGAARWGDPLTISIGGHQVRVSNPERPYFPAVGLTKADVVHYYADVADAMLEWIARRPTTLERWPQGVPADHDPAAGMPESAFYQKRVPPNAPEYVGTARITFPSGRSAVELCPQNPAELVWAANLGTITFHPWPVRRDDPEHPDELRLDFDPQPGTGYAQAATAALAAREVLADAGLTGFPKTSGGRGVHVFVPIAPEWGFLDTRLAAITIGRRLERDRPDAITTAWWKEERGPRVFVDYNQNARDRTIAAAWSVRPRAHAPVSMPLDWSEVGQVEPRDFTIGTARPRLAAFGEVAAEMDRVRGRLDTVLEWAAADERDHGLADLPYPPDYPKMPGEPLRVQPSRRAVRDDG